MISDRPLAGAASSLVCASCPHAALEMLIASANVLTAQLTFMAYPPFSQSRQSTFGSQTSTAISQSVPPFSHPSFGAIHPNIDSVRDDKGNAPTKNLFVAGYGQGTNEQMLRDLFGQFAVVTGVVSKGTFAFVNTSDRHGAVVARENLGGTMFNGGILRINFAKETGRLGTSFDLTYGRNPGQSVNQLVGTAARQQNMGYYG